MQERAFKNDKIKFIWDTVVEEIQGDDEKVTGALLRNVKTDEKQVFPIDGVFIFIGHIPNTELFKGVIDMDDQDYIVVDNSSAPISTAFSQQVTYMIMSSVKR